MTGLDFAIRLLGALGLGTVIGLERQISRHMAGLQTNALVCSGAALFVMSGLMAPGGDHDFRITAQIVTGIGFLGSGVILRDGFHVRGLNTAATLWCTAGVGILMGYGQYWGASGATIMVLFINIVLRKISIAIDRRAGGVRSGEFQYTLQIDVDPAKEAGVRSQVAHLLEVNRLKLHAIDVMAKGGDALRLRIEITGSEAADGSLAQICAGFGPAQGVDFIRWDLAREGST
jgi:putative Mg2+ transporter-C (MgtC) family protein